jgi:hypothetical protein
MEIQNENIHNLKIGSVFYEINEDYKYHVINIFKDNDSNIIVFKYYGKHKQWWHYEVIELWKFNMRIKHEIYYFKDKK